MKTCGEKATLEAAGRFAVDRSGATDIGYAILAVAIESLLAVATVMSDVIERVYSRLDAVFTN